MGKQVNEQQRGRQHNPRTSHEIRKSQGRDLSELCEEEYAVKQS